MILNESEKRRAGVRPNLAVVAAQVTVRYEDVALVPLLETAVTGAAG